MALIALSLSFSSPGLDLEFHLRDHEHELPYQYWN